MRSFKMALPLNLTSWQAAASVDGGLEAYAEKWGRDKAESFAVDCLCGMTLGRDFAESMEDYLNRNPARKATYNRCKAFLNQKQA
jgi:hypothetical protein